MKIKNYTNIDLSYIVSVVRHRTALDPRSSRLDEYTVEFNYKVLAIHYDTSKRNTVSLHVILDGVGSIELIPNTIGLNNYFFYGNQVTLSSYYIPSLEKIVDYEELEG